MNKLVGWVVILVVLGAAAYFLDIGGFRGKVDEAVGNKWTAEKRRAKPVEFIDFSMKKLQENVDKFEIVRDELRGSQKRLDQMKTENANKLDFAVKNLAEFKTAFGTATSGGKWPISVAGAAYGETDLKRQVGLLLSQKKGYENVAGQVEKSINGVEKRLNEVVDRINDSKAKLGMLESQRALVKANQLSKETEKILAEVNDVLLENEAFNEKSAVRTVEEMMKEAQDAAAPGSNPDVDAFLKG